MNRATSNNENQINSQAIIFKPSCFVLSSYQLAYSPSPLLLLTSSFFLLVNELLISYIPLPEKSCWCSLSCVRAMCPRKRHSSLATEFLNSIGEVGNEQTNKSQPSFAPHVAVFTITATSYFIQNLFHRIVCCWCPAVVPKYWLLLNFSLKMVTNKLINVLN